MAALADEAALTARIGTLNAAQQARTAALLADASGLVRRHTRQDFELVTDDIVVFRSQGQTIQLLQRPVIDVTAVVAIGVPPIADLALPVGTWAWDGIDKIQLQTDLGFVINLPADWTSSQTSSYRITYSHGYATIPDDIVAVVANMVNRVLTAPTLADGLTGENIGQYGYQTQQTAGSQGTGVRLTFADREALIPFRRKGRTIETPVR